MASFMLEIFGTKGMVVTYDIVTYLSSMVAEAFSAVVGESGASVLDLAAEAAGHWILQPGKAKGRHPSAACKELLQKKPAQAGVADCV